MAHIYGMKTTLDISDHLLIEAKKLAAEERRSLRKVVEDALRLFISHHRRVRRGAGKVDLPVCNAGKPLPGVDLNDTSKLLEME